MCQEVQELKNELTMLFALKKIYSEIEYKERTKLWRKKWVDMALTHNCSDHNEDKMNFTISLN